MKGSIALGWLLATVIFALLGNSILTVVFFIGASIFSMFTIANDYRSIKNYTDNEWFNRLIDSMENIEKGETDER